MTNVLLVTKQTEVSKELTNLDCLRAFAVSAVLVCHIGRMLAWTRNVEPGVWLAALGRMGVLAFFVHTSLVLMFSLERLSRSPGHITSRFYLRRAFRIYPLSIAFVIGCLAFRVPDWPMPGSSFFLPSPKVIAANLLLVQNLVGREHYSVLGPLWSLPYEVQMYILLPPCFFIFGRKARGLVYLCAVWLVFAGIGEAVKYRTGHANLLGFVPCFLSGVLAYTLRHKVRPVLTAAAWPLFLVAWFAIWTLALAKWRTLEMQGGFLACLILGFSIYYFHDSRDAAWNKSTHLMAKYSYGTYLGHAPMLWLVFSFWGITGPVPSTIVWLAMTGVLAVLCYHLLEEPMINIGRRISVRFDQHEKRPVLNSRSVAAD